MFHYELGVQQNEKLALEWHSKSAKQGDEESQINISLLNSLRETTNSTLRRLFHTTDKKEEERPRRFLDVEDDSVEDAIVEYETTEDESIEDEIVKVARVEEGPRRFLFV